jgi:hypothetical protein
MQLHAMRNSTFPPFQVRYLVSKLYNEIRQELFYYFLNLQKFFEMRSTMFNARECFRFTDFRSIGTSAFVTFVTIDNTKFPDTVTKAIAGILILKTILFTL